MSVPRQPSIGGGAPRRSGFSFSSCFGRPAVALDDRPDAPTEHPRSRSTPLDAVLAASKAQAPAEQAGQQALVGATARQQPSRPETEQPPPFAETQPSFGPMASHALSLRSMGSMRPPPGHALHAAPVETLEAGEGKVEGEAQEEGELETDVRDTAHASAPAAGAGAARKPALAWGEFTGADAAAYRKAVLAKAAGGGGAAAAADSEAEQTKDGSSGGAAMEGKAVPATAAGDGATATESKAAPAKLDGDGGVTAEGRAAPADNGGGAPIDDVSKAALLEVAGDGTAVGIDGKAALALASSLARAQAAAASPEALLPDRSAVPPMARQEAAAAAHALEAAVCVQPMAAPDAAAAVPEGAQPAPAAALLAIASEAAELPAASAVPLETAKPVPAAVAVVAPAVAATEPVALPAAAAPAAGPKTVAPPVFKAADEAAPLANATEPPASEGVLVPVANKEMPPASEAASLAKEALPPASREAAPSAVVAGPETAAAAGNPAAGATSMTSSLAVMGDQPSETNASQVLKDGAPHELAAGAVTEEEVPAAAAEAEDGGVAPPAPLERLSSSRFRRLIEDARHHAGKWRSVVRAALKRGGSAGDGGTRTPPPSPLSPEVALEGEEGAGAKGMTAPAAADEAPETALAAAAAAPAVSAAPASPVNPAAVAGAPAAPATPFAPAACGAAAPVMYAVPAAPVVTLPEQQSITPDSTSGTAAAVSGGLLQISGSGGHAHTGSGGLGGTAAAVQTLSPAASGPTQLPPLPAAAPGDLRGFASDGDEEAVEAEAGAGKEAQGKGEGAEGLGAKEQKRLEGGVDGGQLSMQDVAAVTGPALLSRLVSFALNIGSDLESEVDGAEELLT